MGIIDDQSPGGSPYATAIGAGATGAATGGMGWAPLAVGGIGAISSYLGSKSAASAQAEASAHAADVQKQIYDQQRADAEPWRQAGMKGLSGITNNLGQYTRNFTMADYTADPGSAFRMQEGQNALEHSAAARGMTQSGATLKALTRYGQDYGSNEYNNAYNRFNNDNSTSFNRLSSLAGMGQTANGQMANAGSNYMNNASDSIYRGGNAAAVSAAAPYSAANQGLGNWMAFSMANKGG